MKKHIVTCVKCGRQFDANGGGAYYPESRRYVCKRCVDKQKSEQSDREKARKAEERKAEADERERVSGMRQSKAATVCFVGGNSDDFGKLSESLYVRLYRPHF